MKGTLSRALHAVLAGWENTQYLLGCHSTLAGGQTLKLKLLTLEVFGLEPAAGFSLNGVSALSGKNQGHG